MARDIQLFGILDTNDKWFIILNDDGTYISGTFEEAARLNVLQLEEWLKIIKAFNIQYKVKAFQYVST